MDLLYLVLQELPAGVLSDWQNEFEKGGISIQRIINQRTDRVRADKLSTLPSSEEDFIPDRLDRYLHLTTSMGEMHDKASAYLSVHTLRSRATFLRDPKWYLHFTSECAIDLNFQEALETGVVEIQARVLSMCNDTPSIIGLYLDSALEDIDITTIPWTNSLMSVLGMMIQEFRVSFPTHYGIDTIAGFLQIQNYTIAAHTRARERYLYGYVWREMSIATNRFASNLRIDTLVDNLYQFRVSKISSGSAEAFEIVSVFISCGYFPPPLFDRYDSLIKLGIEHVQPDLIERFDGGVVSGITSTILRTIRITPDLIDRCRRMLKLNVSAEYRTSLRILLGMHVDLESIVIDSARLMVRVAHPQVTKALIDLVIQNDNDFTLDNMGIYYDLQNMLKEWSLRRLDIKHHVRAALYTRGKVSDMPEICDMTANRISLLKKYGKPSGEFSYPLTEEELARVTVLRGIVPTSAEVSVRRQIQARYEKILTLLRN